MQQYMLTNECFNDKKVSFPKDDLHHIYKVMRCQTNDLIEVVNIESKTKYLVSLNDDGLTGNILNMIDDSSELKHDLILGYGLVKADKLEFVIQKACELGVTKFIPLMMDHSIVSYDDKKLDKKMQRWEKIIKEASEQAHRNALMEIVQPIPLSQFIKEESDVSLVAYEKASIDDKISSLDLKEQSVKLVIGPEGGISTSEMDLLESNDFKVVSLGKRILRTETAVISALSLIIDNME